MSDANQEKTRSRIVEHIVDELAHSLGQSADRIDPRCLFVDMGADSLILAETLQDINRRYRVTLSVGEMYESVNTIEKVADYLHANGQYGPVLEDRARRAGVVHTGEREPAASLMPLSEPAQAAMTTTDASSIEQLIRKQLDLMERQLALLHALPEASTTIESASTPTPLPAAADACASTAAPSQNDRFNAFAARLDADQRESDADKVEHVASLAAAHNARTPSSKTLAQRYRRVLSDNRVSAGFRPLLKELVYPVLAETAEGAHIVDIDGNRYLDFTMGFGVHLFGHSPSFVTERIRQQLERGIPIGPQTPMAGRVAELITELTGHERVVFCNSGTEATMTAVRLARLASGRDKVVVFKNSYHGSFDGFLARRGSGGETHAASLGTPDSFVADTVVLDYCDDASLDYLDAHHAEIGVVMVEPVQSRAPSLDPRTFLARLREITTRRGIVLIFDEVISGFRCARGGAQAYFGVRADLCTYGKIVGGGMPIGIVAGTSACMDGIDGGWWQFGDDSYPGKSTIFFAGTFSKHPLTMAASLAVLEHLKDADDDFYNRLNAQTRELAIRLNAVFAEEGVDITVEHFSSLFRLASKGNLDLFFYHLLANGIYIWEGRNCFVSTAHSADDLDRLVAAVHDVCRALKPFGLVPLLQTRSGADRKDEQAIAFSDAQARFVAIERASPEGRIANNVCFAFRFDSPVDAQRVATAVEHAVCAHDALGASFALEAGTQILSTAKRFSVEHFSHADPLDEATACELANREQERPLSVEHGENARAQLHTFAHGKALLVLSLHHVACDGWSLGVLLDEIAQRYNGRAMQPALSYAAWMDHEREYRASDRYMADKRYWTEAIERVSAYRAQCATAPIGHAGDLAARPGSRARVAISAAVTEAVGTQAKRCGVTTFTWLLACVQLFLSRIYSGRSPVIGLPFANRTAKLRGLVGNCVNLPFIIPAHGAGLTFDDVLASTRGATSTLMNHSRFPYRELCELYRARHPGGPASPVEITFNVEPLTHMPAFGECTPELIAPVNGRIEFDMMFNVFLLPDGMRIELDYNRDLLKADVTYGWLYLLAKLIENEATAMQPSELSA